MDSEPQFEQIADGLRAGDDAAAAAVFWRFACRLIALARTRLDQTVRTKVDPEDLVQSVFRSFFSRYTSGQFQLESWDGIWTILTLITVRKCQNKCKHYRAERRDVGREVGFSYLNGINAGVLSREPTPQQAAMLTEMLEGLLRNLTGRQREILALHLQGHTVAEISVRLDRTERTVRRVLRRVRDELEEKQACND